ncbi:Hpt domain-containing protein [Methylocystis sp. WRRC1]|uniref:Hpt domain-containing protein n=1 Tax=Methylocystis sp. WRRC1 TaxID=1732014 RepID=UPI001D142738|nr:Hpt domain-containing protein [Methylocystis sp. WRRC1]
MSDELEEIWALYADDGGQSLDAVEAALRTLRRNAWDAEAIGGLFRAMHTFKGNSRILGLTTIESCAHVAEDLVGLVRDEGAKVDGELLDLMLEAADALRGMMEKTIVTRRDAEESVCADILLRMKDKYARLKEAGVAFGVHMGEGPTGISDVESGEQESFQTAVIFSPPEAKPADDPMYLEMFLDMARDALDAMREALTSRDEGTGNYGEALYNAASPLHDAAVRISIDEWPELTKELMSAGGGVDRAGALLDRLSELFEKDLARLQGAPVKISETSDSLVQDGADFPRELEPLLDGLSQAAQAFPCEDESVGENIRRFAMAIQEWAARLGYQRIAETSAQLPDAASNLDEFERLMFALYEDLILVEEMEAIGNPSAELQVAATTPLGAWCAARTPATLAALRTALSNPAGEEVDWARMAELLRRVYRACCFQRHETAGHVVIALVDLAARVHAGEMSPDPPLMRVLASFVDAAKPLFGATNSDVASSAEAMAGLLREAREVTEALNGAPSIALIEEQLGLPQSFRGVLSSESATVATLALKTGSRFYIIRADIERHSELAEGFIEWIGAAGALIGSVTVFDRDATLFDFLIASALDSQAIGEGLTALDPTGAVLRLEMALGRSGGDPDMDDGESEAPSKVQDGQFFESSAPSMKMLESIGEIVTGHATVRQILAGCGETDVVGLIDAAMRASGGDWSAARDAVRRQVQDWQENIERLVQLESQLSNRLDQLQEEAVSARARPASGLLKALVSHGEDFARRLSRFVRFKVSGQTESIDIDLLEQFSEPLRSLISFVLAESIEPSAARIAAGKAACAEVQIRLARHEDRIVATIEDDGAGVDTAKLQARIQRPAGSGSPKSSSGVSGHEGQGVDFALMLRGLRLSGGELAIANSTLGGVRFDVTLPLTMAVLDGMVVRVGAIMYVVPIHAIQRIVHSGDADLMRFSAANGGTMLKLERNDVIPVRFLSGAGGDDEDADQRLRPLPPANDNAETGDLKHLFVVTGSRDQRIALSIDELIGQQLVLIRPMKGYLSAIRDVMGCALLGNGGVGMVLDPARLTNCAS